ncbi:putative molybdopterin biosynthesis protein [Methanomicrobium sp. W14]|uniref:molybdopterin biosynthesis protein n=1 Tax=Methanomicrobium sp. W14 TaxID=2817839 RepID=UPI001AE37188|nr:putative molybdopterin biosynthesis protein [Methanomicrobium sp. W14]
MVKRYLSQVSLDDAVSKVLSSFDEPKSRETVSLKNSCGRVLREPVYAGYPVPCVNTSAMDGIAVKSAETVGASEQNPVALGKTLRVNTGNFVPPEFDSVVMIEDTWEKNGVYSVRKAARPWQNVRPAGEDIKKGELIAPAGHRMRAFDTGAFGTYGIKELCVRKLSAGLVPTGSELVEIGNVPGPGQVVESNIPMASVWFSERKVDARCYPITPDDPEMIKKAVEKAAVENDIVIVSAGSSAGTKDFTAGAISELGELIFHGIAIMPGKPMILGKVMGKPVIGLPGYPISAQVVLREIVGPLLDKWGFTGPLSGKIDVELSSDITSNVGYDEFVLLSVAEKDGRYLAAQQSRGAGVQMASVRSNAFLRVPSRLEGYPAGETVSVTLTQGKSYADGSLLVTGMADPALGVLSGILRKSGVVLHIGSSGNMGGVIALKKDVCHCAPMHIPSPDGEYNIEQVKRYLPETKVSLLCIAGISYGIASRNNLSLKDVAKHSFVNQPPGSEPRILFDRAISEEKISSELVEGYDKVLNSETAVAMSVLNGDCDAAFVSYQSAKVYGLDFSPVSYARYEFAVRDSGLSDERIKKLVEAVSSDEFKSALKNSGGYDVSVSGKMRSV